MGSVRYAHDGYTWVLRFEGNADFSLAPSVDAFLNRLFLKAPQARFAVDLTRTERIDSTILGLLVRIANHMQQGLVEKPAIIGPNEKVKNSLLTACFDQLFHIVAANSSPTLPNMELPKVSTDERQMLELVLEAHRRLCAIDAQTHQEFRDVVTTAEAELAKLPPRDHS